MAETELYLIRHGLAGTRDPNRDDRLRSLTSAGRRRTRSVARHLARRGVHFDLLLSSPLLRASETAGILRDRGLAERVEEAGPLRPGGQLKRLLAILRTRKGRLRRVALVGHEPDLSEWAERLVWGSVRHRLVLKKAGIIGLTLPPEGSPVGRCQLFLLVPPRLLV